MSHQDALLVGGKVQATPGYRRSCAVHRLGALRTLRRAHLRGDLLRPGHHAGHGRSAGLRPREVRVLRRVPVELPGRRDLASKPAREACIPLRTEQSTFSQAKACATFYLQVAQT